MHKIIPLLVKANFQIYVLEQIISHLSKKYPAFLQVLDLNGSILKDLIWRISFSIHLATFFPFPYLFLKKKEGSRRTSNHQMPESFAGMKSSGTGTSWLLCFSIAHSFDVKAAATAS